MIVIFGLLILVAAVIVSVAGVLSNGGSAHALTHGFAVFGYHVTGSTGTLFLCGIVVGAVALFGLSSWPARAAPPAAAARRAADSSSPAARRPLSARPATTSSTSARPPALTRRARRGTAYPAATAISTQTTVIGAGCTCSGTDPPAGSPPPHAQSRSPASAPPMFLPICPRPAE
jgi:hypothetical protein